MEICYTLYRAKNLPIAVSNQRQSKVIIQPCFDGNIADFILREIDSWNPKV